MKKQILDFKTNILQRDELKFIKGGTHDQDSAQGSCGYCDKVVETGPYIPKSMCESYDIPGGDPTPCFCSTGGGCSYLA